MAQERARPSHPAPDQAAIALDRLSRREHFTSPDDRVFCKVLGRALDGSTVRKRFSALAIRPVYALSASTTYDTPTGRSSPPPA